MPLLKKRPWYDPENSQRLTSICLIVIVIIATVDAFTVPVLGMGFLYLIPLSLAAAFWSRWQLVVMGVICTAFWDGFSNLPYTEIWLLRDAFVFLSFVFVTFLVNDMVVYRRAASSRIEGLEHEVRVAVDAGSASDSLVNASPVAMLKIGPDGEIITSNRAAHDVFGVGFGGLIGKKFKEFVPDVDWATDSECESEIRNTRAQRANGERFEAHIWISGNLGEGGEVVVAVAASEAVGAGKVNA